MKRRLSSLFLVLSVLQIQAQTVSSEKKTGNIAAFARLYGYVRYFHPSQEATMINWDKFVYYGIREVENAANPKVLNQKLNDLFNPIAPAVLIYTDAAPKKFNIKNLQPSGIPDLQNVAWQHYGMGAPGGLYNSIRTNTSIAITEEKKASFGTITNSVSAKPYRGKKFRLKAFIKTDVLNNGQGQMWLRIDCENNKRGFFDNMGNRPVTSNKWKECEITGQIDGDADNIVFGVFLLGSGKVWTDKFSLEIEDGGKWTSIPVSNPSFEEDNEQPKGWYGAAQGYQFKVVSAEAIEGRNVMLISDSSSIKAVTTIFDTKPVFGDHFIKSLGNGLSCAVPLVLMGNAAMTYPAADPAKLAALKDKLDSVEQIPYPYAALSGVTIAWNIFRHFYPYQDEINTDWAVQLPVCLTAAGQCNTLKDYGRIIKVLTEKLRDGHVYVSIGSADYFSMPAGATLAEGKIIISKLDPVSDPSEQLPLKAGDEILSIDGIPALQKLEQMKKEISGSAQWKNHRALSELFLGPKDSEMRMKIKNNGTEKEISIIRKNYRNEKDTATIKKLNDEIYYINIGNTEMKDITSVLPELAGAKGIICDLRGYPKNNHMFISHLLSVQDTSKWMFVPKIIRPDYEDVMYNGLGWDMKPQTPHLSAKIIFLTGGGAISYAESYIGFIKQYKLATIVGQPTAGANGNVNSFKLPGGVGVSFTGMKVRQQDGSPLQGIGIQPDVFVKETVKGITEGHDEFLEKAIELLK